MDVARSAFHSRKLSELGVVAAATVLASLLEGKSPAEKAARDVARFGSWRVAVSRKRREDAHALQKSGNCRTKLNTRVVDFTAFSVPNVALITPRSRLV